MADGALGPCTEQGCGKIVVIKAARGAGRAAGGDAADSPVVSEGGVECGGKDSAQGGGANMEPVTSSAREGRSAGISAKGREAAAAAKLMGLLEAVSGDAMEGGPPAGKDLFKTQLCKAWQETGRCDYEL